METPENIIRDSYRSISGPAEGLFKDNGSRPCCRRPILGQIDSKGLSDVLVVVVRYFGGIKLGVPGLIRAYKTSTAEALEKAGSVEKVAGKWFQVSFGYEAMNSVMKILKDMDLRQQGQNFGSECSLRTWVRLSAENDFRSRMEKVENCHINEL